MGKIYDSQEDYDRAAEEEFKIKCEEIAYYQGDIERTTLDGEWTEQELKDDLWDEANKFINGTKESKGWLETHKGRAMRDTDLCKVQYLVEDICTRYDMIEVYNKVVDMLRIDEHKLFGIEYFDQIARAEIEKTLKQNLVTG